MKRSTVLLISFFVFLLCGLNTESRSENAQGLCTKVFDGDTIEVTLDKVYPKWSNPVHVRLIGVDTPEISHPLKPVQYFAEESSSFTKKMVFGKRVRLEFDWQREDKYGRLLAYVFLLDGRMLNAEIIKQGYGFAYTRFPFRYLEEFKQYEREARSKGPGLWKGGGKAELKWLIGEKRIPFRVYEMANNQWAVEYQKYIRTRLNDEELMAVLNRLRVLVHELNDRDLRETLLKQGWEEMD